MTAIWTSRTLAFKDELRQRDELGHRIHLRGDLTMMDDSGRIIFRNLPNLITIRGRVVAMERTFGELANRTAVGSDRDTGQNQYVDNFTRSIYGRPESCPLKCHGEGDDVRKGHLAAIRRRFRSGCRATSSDHVTLAMRAHPALDGAKQRP